MQRSTLIKLLLPLLLVGFGAFGYWSAQAQEADLPLEKPDFSVTETSTSVFEDIGGGGGGGGGGGN